MERDRNGSGSTLTTDRFGSGYWKAGRDTTILCGSNQSLLRGFGFPTINQVQYHIVRCLVTSECFAVIPAAGLSRRMGQPKLLLPWKGTTVLENLMSELSLAGIEHRYVVVRKSDTKLADLVRSTGSIPVQPLIDPPDMKASVIAALEAEAAGDRAGSSWLLIPADHPMVSARVVRQLIERWTHVSGEYDVIVPTCNGRRGHPALFRDRVRERLNEIPSDRGLNWLMRESRLQCFELAVSDADVLTDLDTPEDYRRLTGLEPPA